MWATAAAHEAASVTSHSTPPSTGTMSARTTMAPSFSRRSATAAPIPLAAPDTNATCPANRAMPESTRSCRHRYCWPPWEHWTQRSRRSPARPCSESTGPSTGLRGPVRTTPTSATVRRLAGQGHLIGDGWQSAKPPASTYTGMRRRERHRPKSGWPEWPTSTGRWPRPVPLNQRGRASVRMAGRQS